MREQHNLVINFVEGGLPLSAALIAADIMLNQQEEQHAAVVARRSPVHDRDNVIEVETERISPVRLPESLMAAKVGLSTRPFNAMLRLQGFLRRMPLINKPVRGKSGLVSTYVLTEKGQEFGRPQIYLSYEDGEPAVFKHSWSDALIEQLVL
jgi:hypothetical protein